MLLSAGDRFDRYTIEALLGEGGMGRVYRARDPKLDRSVALKVLHANVDDGAGWMLREARAAAALDHPNVIAIFDVGEVEQTPYIAMELVRGRSLRAAMRDPNVALATKLRWLVDIARALAKAHHIGLVHRDVKPGNVLVRDDGVLKVLDFGIARRTPALDAEPSTLSRAGVLVGTPQYMAPEQVRNAPIDGRVDQFAWGVMAYELLGGKLPWRDTSGAAVFAAILHQDVEPLRDVPDGVAAAVARALAKDRDARFATMTDAADALEPFAARSAATPQPAPPDEEPRTIVARPTRAPRRGLALGVLATAAIVGVAIALVVGRGGRARGVAVTDLPPPDERNAEALAAYRDGMQAYRDGVLDADQRAFERALALDASFAAPHLRLAYLLYPVSETEGRTHFQRAAQARASLTAHDQLLFDALEPYLRREPADDAETERRLRAATEQFPDDADFALYYANARFHRGTAGVEAFERAIAIDPKFGNAYAYVVEKKLYLGDFAGADATAEACLREVPSATRCSLVRGMADIVRGNCARVEADARRAIAIDETSSRAYRYLAAAEVGLGKPLDAAREALDQARARIADPIARERARLFDTFALDVLRGDFTAAEADARELERAVAASPSRALHAGAARQLVELYEELGRDDDAAAVAKELLDRQDAWTRDPRAENFAIARDPTIVMLAALERAHRITPAELEQRRAAWIDAWRAQMLPRYLPYIWIHAFAEPARTRDDAAAALAALARAPPIAPYHPHTFADGDVGRVHLLGGRIDDGLAATRTAVASCLATEFPIAHTRAALALGLALAGKGDTAGACAAFDIVLRRWGNATASSSAQRARREATTLGCR